MPIRILPETLSNKIAAGEVVERPASVVKELLENAIDAGSRRIRVEAERGGKALVRVSDDGAGMGKDDALLSIERYATSKIADERDLFSIRTLGFRGEALPSIASVSRFSLVTRRSEDEVGTQIDIEGGTIRRVVETGAPPGTMVTVRGLFFNTPARRKFLKTVATETGHIAEVFSAVALAHPRIGFRLLQDGKTMKHWPPVKDGRDRAADVLGTDLHKGLFPVYVENDDFSLTGWVGSPSQARSTSRGVYAFVNGRWVKDRMLQHALFSGYTGRLMKGRYPVAVLFVRVPFDRVDVNVHPAKSEVRFADAPRVHGRVAEAVRRALADGDRPDWTPAAKTGEEPFAERTKTEARPPGLGVQGFTKEAQEPWRPETNKEQTPKARPEGLPADGPALSRSGGRPSEVFRQGAASGKHRHQQGIWRAGRFSDLRVVGQYANSYIVCEAHRRLVLVDQHAAHERILYERIRGRSEAESPPSQGLLLSETVSLSPREAATLTELIPRLAAEGFDIEPFGGQDFVVRAVPAMLVDREIGPILREIVEKAVAVGVAEDPAAIDAVQKILACHGAVRAHQSMTEKQMAALLSELDACQDPAHCPHGRPTWIEWPESELEKRFGR